MYHTHLVAWPTRDVLNLVGVVLITLLIYFVAGPLLGIRLEKLPHWAE